MRHANAIAIGGTLVLLPVFAEWVEWIIALLFPVCRRLTIDETGIRYRLGPHSASFRWDNIATITTEADRKGHPRYRIEINAATRPGLRGILRIPVSVVWWLLAIVGDFIAVILAGQFSGASFADEAGLGDEKLLPAAYPIKGAYELARPS